MQLECGMYQITTDCGEKFFYEVKNGFGEKDIYCPCCMEHLYSLVVAGDSFEPVTYFGKGLVPCSSLDTMKWTLTSSQNFENLIGLDLVGKKQS
ncbi:hypothetical protein V7128_05785 [Neobacillus vireti]|uniref:hypothetical protein n=1 Tax=Neobacillus vireti TaxID=220686 RepID=UPI002FFD7915